MCIHVHKLQIACCLAKLDKAECWMNKYQIFRSLLYVVCLKSKCTDFLFKCLLDSHEITSCLLQSMTLGKLHIGSNVFFTDHGSTGSHFL